MQEMIKILIQFANTEDDGEHRPGHGRDTLSYLAKCGGW